MLKKMEQNFKLQQIKENKTVNETGAYTQVLKILVKN